MDEARLAEIEEASRNRAMITPESVLELCAALREARARALAAEASCAAMRVAVRDLTAMCEERRMG